MHLGPDDAAAPDVDEDWDITYLKNATVRGGFFYLYNSRNLDCVSSRRGALEIIHESLSQTRLGPRREKGRAVEKRARG